MAWLDALDRWLLEALAGLRFPLADQAALSLTALGSTTLLLLLVPCVWPFYARSGRPLGGVLLRGLVALAVLELGKYTAFRPRPPEGLCIIPAFTGPRTPSFPSGHALCSAALFCSLALALPRPWRKPGLRLAFVLSFLAGVSRLWLGAHWPSDVYCGWAFGLACAFWFRRPEAAPDPAVVAASLERLYTGPADPGAAAVPTPAPEPVGANP